MRFWQDNRKIVIFVGVSFLLLILVVKWTKFPWPLTRRAKEPVVCWPYANDAVRFKQLVNTLITRDDKLKAYYPEEELEPRAQSPAQEVFDEFLALLGLPPRQTRRKQTKVDPPDGMAFLRDYTKDLDTFEQSLDKQMGGLRSFMSHVTYQPYRVPKWEPEPGYRFMVTLEEKKNELMELVEEMERKNPHRGDIPILFDQPLGFNFQNPPTASKTQFLMTQLGIISNVVEMAFYCGITQVDRISPRPTYENKGSANEEFFEEYPVDFSMLGTMPAVMKLLHSLNGVHGELAINEKTKFLQLNRGSDHGLRSGETVVISRKGKFVTTATVEALGKQNSRLSTHEFNDGYDRKEQETKTGDRVWNHYYVLRTMGIEPSRNPIYANAGMLKVGISLAALKFKEAEIVTEDQSKAPRGGVRPKGGKRIKGKPITGYKW